MNFTSLSTGSPLSKLPLDPINTTSSGEYYTYTPGGSYELTSSMESSKYKMGGSNDSVSKDGGPYPDLHEIGSDLALLPVDYGDPSLVGYWKLNEGTGATIYDASGHGHTGTFNGSVTWQSGSNCEEGNCIYLDGSSYNNYILCGSSSMITSPAYTIAGFVNIPSSASSTAHRSLVSLGNSLPEFDPSYSNTSRSLIYLNGGNYRYGATDIRGNWIYMAAVVTGNNTNDILNSAIYINGKMDTVYATTYSQPPLFPNGSCEIGSGSFIGSINDVRIYNRALSAAEVQALYNAEK